MVSRHHQRNHGVARSHLFVALASFVIAFAAITAAVAVHVIDGSAAPAAAPERQSAPAVPAGPQPLSQEGRIIAVTATSVTAQSADGFARTYAINAETNAITVDGSMIGGAATTFAVNDEVAIIGVVQDGTAVATAVADKQVTGLDGPPMDAV